ncbi:MULTISPECIES: hypothetical protein [Eikenella]|uniref:hypothetical protein n=2 Tax=Neisseriaceae TaxID=481 RepID=UPI00129BEF25|nr:MULTISPECIES: hypothetical protein [Eikenella]
MFCIKTGADCSLPVRMGQEGAGCLKIDVAKQRRDDAARFCIIALWYFQIAFSGNKTMENHDYLSCRKEIREWEFGRGLLNGWATVFGAAALLTILAQIALLSGQYRITVLHLGILLLIAVAVCRLVWWQWHGKRTGPREFVRLEEEGIRYCLSGAGEGFVAYEWLQFVNLWGGIFPANCYCNTACRNRPA